MQTKYIKIRFKHYLHRQKTFVCLCRQTTSRIYHFQYDSCYVDMNNIHQFQDIWWTFKRVRVRTDRQMECINTFQLCWKVLKKEHLLPSSNETKTIFIHISCLRRKILQWEMTHFIWLSKCKFKRLVKNIKIGALLFIYTLFIVFFFFFFYMVLLFSFIRL